LLVCHGNVILSINKCLFNVCIILLLLRYISESVGIFRSSFTALTKFFDNLNVMQSITEILFFSSNYYETIIRFRILYVFLNN